MPSVWTRGRPALTPETGSAMQCKDVMRSYVFRCAEEDTLERCARIMRDENIGFLPVMARSRALVGVITDRDLAIHGLAAGRSSSARVAEVMTRGELLTCRPGDDLLLAEERMARS